MLVIQVLSGEEQTQKSTHISEMGCKLFAEVLVLEIKPGNSRGTLGSRGSEHEELDVCE